ncbi:hypothetical protein B0H19DRAFT_1367914 [Mycena capillaripes]|nr:hypothetical protein B0H19DRAFT_1367914 [Mycena capillaripes]
MYVALPRPHSALHHVPKSMHGPVLQNNVESGNSTVPPGGSESHAAADSGAREPPLPRFNWEVAVVGEFVNVYNTRHSRMFPGRQAIARRVYQSPGEPLQFSFPSSFPHAPRSGPEPLPDRRFGRGSKQGRVHGRLRSQRGMIRKPKTKGRKTMRG